MTGLVLVKGWRPLSLIIVAIMFVGCTHYYVPAMYPLKDGMTPAFTGNSSITLINDQESPGTGGKPDFLGSIGAHQWYGDLQKWTATAISLTNTELEERGFRIEDKQDTILKLCISRATVHQGVFQIRTIAYLTVETGDGYKKEFIGNNASGWTLYRACDGAITRAVGEMLSDETILAYITQ